MGSYAAEKNSENTSNWTGSATTVAAEVVVARGKNAEVKAKTVTIRNTGGVAMSFSLDGGTTWLPLAVGEAFDWENVYAISVKTAAGTTTYAIVAGF